MTSGAANPGQRPFNPVAVIARKREGNELTDNEIADFMTGFTRGAVPDYQMSALAMAIFLRGMSHRETAALTDCMLGSGQTLRWPDTSPPIVDKHSTGGIGDKVSLVLAPLLACCGIWVPMISGRGLGPTGGTLDKLESIPGFRTNLSLDELQRVTSEVGCVISGATAEIAPADKKLYSLRDVTATVASIPLITASIMSKKLSEGLDALVLDVKWGSGAFMKTLEEARQLAESLVSTGQRMGVKTTALLTDMNQPLGRMAGNAVEIHEAIDVLSGKGPSDLIEVTLALGAELLVLTGCCEEGQAIPVLQDQLSSGAALEKFYSLVRAQGGRLEFPLPVAPSQDFISEREGWLSFVDAERLGWAIIELGGGRRSLTDRLDHSVGLVVLARLGDHVDRGQPLARVMAHGDGAHRIRDYLKSALIVADEPGPTPELIRERIA